ncbi:nitrite/sulfite reductase [Sphingosinicella sp. LHD-64]|uniref:nitrite/sulfite reductase n=1 Tax=Sphingosinicella sp. LHD-64 TaxID=3072139 RepID=UPI00280EF2C8|nr:nitrite/sulfite reductase [Sphingosinicella sp. LHD-64]MDQ8757202.1 nitrite/sulfite reductase [Sphingosinicella sp. LHD-64]
MYRYDEFDERIVRERAAQFRAQVGRRLDGSLTEEEFTPLRLMNGLYLQLHAYMLRVAIPYGTLDSRQMRQLAMIADKWDRGFGHLTTRQNIQYNWPKLQDTPDILDALADVGMHAIQTSGNCIRNVTADHFAGVAADEIEDPRPTAELIRQWSILHPEFSFLPRKFKIAVTGAAEDRAAVAVHDIGIRIVRSEAGELGYKVLVGGGLGRTPFIGKTIRDFLPKADLLAYLEAIMRVYNLEGRRDNKYKARIKILVHEIGTAPFIARVEEEFAKLDGPSVNADLEEVARIAAYFAPPDYETLPAASAVFDAARAQDPAFDRFAATNLFPHRVPGYTAITVSAKPIGAPPGDLTSDRMRALADLAERYSLDELRITHVQNVVLPHVKLDDVPAVWVALVEAGLETANAGLITDIISCPGMDYCKLATARSIPIAQEISKVFADAERQREIGPLGIKISGCINACGHHHVGSIGILGLDKAGVENYQITLGGDPGEGASLGERLGPGIDGDEVPAAIERIVDVYLGLRTGPGETFIDTVRRVGLDPFKPALQLPEAIRAAA